MTENINYNNHPDDEHLQETTEIISEADQDSTEGKEELTPQEALRRKVIEVFGEDQRVKFAIAMGSSAEGKENKLSDVDVCLVMNDDAELNEILEELNEIFPKLGKLVGFYKYNPYHFYVVYEPSVPLDIYFISSSLYFTMKSDKNKTIVDHSNRDIKPQANPLQPGEETGETQEAEKGIEGTISDLFLKGWIRTFRLLSKIEKNDFPTLAYILNRIREEQIVPLLTMIEGYNIPHAKAIKLESFDDNIKKLFVDTYCKPEKSSCMQAVMSSAELLKILFEKASQDYNLEEMRSFAEKTYEQILEYAQENSSE